MGPDGLGADRKGSNIREMVLAAAPDLDQTA